MPSQKLTATFIKNIKDAGTYVDQGSPGLRLNVSKAGTMNWTQRLTIYGKVKELGLGGYPIVSLKDAREKAFGNKKIAASGKDPRALSKKEQEIPFFKNAAYEVWEIQKAAWKNGKHIKQWIQTLETYAFKEIGELKVSEITTFHIQNILLPIWNIKPETAKRVQQRLEKVMDWVIANGYRADNPVSAIASSLPKQDQSNRKNMRSLDCSEVSNCIRSVRDSKANIFTKLAFEFLVLTAARSGEIRNAVWSEIDIEKASWTIPAEKMKAKKEHKVPLSSQSIEILHQAKRNNTNTDLIFPSPKTNKPMSDMTLSKLVRELGFNTTVHGFRTSFKQWAVTKTNYPNELSERALAHSIKNKVEAAYNRDSQFNQRIPMMQDWAEYLSG